MTTRDGGDRQGAVLGALGIFFDWGPQAQAIVDGLRLSDEGLGWYGAIVQGTPQRGSGSV